MQWTVHKSSAFSAIHKSVPVNMRHGTNPRSQEQSNVRRFGNRTMRRPTVRLLYTVELQWLAHLWNHENMLKTGVVRANECES